MNLKELSEDELYYDIMDSIPSTIQEGDILEFFDNEIIGKYGPQIVDRDMQNIIVKHYYDLNSGYLMNDLLDKFISNGVEVNNLTLTEVISYCEPDERASLLKYFMKKEEINVDEDIIEEFIDHTAGDNFVKMIEILVSESDFNWTEELAVSILDKVDGYVEDYYREKVIPLLPREATALLTEDKYKKMVVDFSNPVVKIKNNDDLSNDLGDCSMF